MRAPPTLNRLRCYYHTPAPQSAPSWPAVQTLVVSLHRTSQDSTLGAPSRRPAKVCSPIPPLLSPPPFPERPLGAGGGAARTERV